MRPAVLAVVGSLVLVAAACSDAGDAGAPAAAPASVTTAAPRPTGPAPPTTATSVPPATTSAPATTTSVAATTTTALREAGDLSLALEPVATGLDAPVFLTSPSGDRRVFVVEQPGRVLVLDGGQPQTFLDVRDHVRFGGERGLLGLAFHPDYASNGRLFVHYSDASGDTALVEYRASAADPNRADPGTARRLLAVPQPAANHNGGMVAFGPDGHLYLGLGDGGAANDRFGNGQRPDTLLATILRLDVDGGEPYAIPADNPFAGGAGGAPEVWAYGLRNPWRFAFDEGFVYIADVGQNAWEEVHVAPAAAAGLNYGWPIMEGNACFQSPDCTPDGLELPEIAYDHGDGCSITGGFVYRGSAIPELDGHYFYGDFCTGFVRSWHRDSGTTFDWTGQLGDVRGLSSFGLDGAGELYVLSLGGDVWRLVRG